MISRKGMFSNKYWIVGLVTCIVLILMVIFHSSGLLSNQDLVVASRAVQKVFLGCTPFPKDLVETGFVVSACNGRLGNQLGVLSLAMAIYLKFGIRLALNPDQHKILANAFDMEKACADNGTTFCIRLPDNVCSIPSAGVSGRLSVGDREEIWKRGLDAFGQTPSDLFGKRVDIPMYPVFLPMMANGFLAEFRKQVPFKDDVLSNAKQLFQNMKDLHNCSHLSEGCTMVSIHLRLGDYPNWMHAQKYPEIVFETNYLSNALHHVIDNYVNPVFYILGEFKGETKKAVKNLRNEFKSSKIVMARESRQNKGLSIGIDMALIAMADVALLTYGSFGDFGGLLYKDKREVLFPLGHPMHGGPEDHRTGVNFGMPPFKGLTWTVTSEVS